MRCVLPHTQRCHESKACTSPATALYFSSKQTATATAGGRRASVEQVGTGGEGRRRGGAVIHILPPPLRCPPVRHRWQAIPRASCPPPPPPPPPCQTPQTASGTAVKGGEWRGQPYAEPHIHTLPSSSPPACAPLVGVWRLGLVRHHASCVCRAYSSLVHVVRDACVLVRASFAVCVSSE